MKYPTYEEAYVDRDLAAVFIVAVLRSPLSMMNRHAREQVYDLARRHEILGWELLDAAYQGARSK